MAENLHVGVKIQAILKKLEKLGIMANIEETVHRLDSEVQVLKTRTAKLEKNVEELKEGFKYNEDDVRDLQRDNKTLEQEVYDLKKQFLYMETYSKILRRTKENRMHHGRGISGTASCLNNTREVTHQFLEEKLKFEQPRKKIEFQRIHT